MFFLPPSFAWSNETLMQIAEPLGFLHAVVVAQTAKVIVLQRIQRWWHQGPQHPPTAWVSPCHHLQVVAVVRDPLHAKKGINGSQSVSRGIGGHHSLHRGRTKQFGSNHSSWIGLRPTRSKRQRNGHGVASLANRSTQRFMNHHDLPIARSRGWQP
jgi:hypothetical protein